MSNVFKNSTTQKLFSVKQAQATLSVSRGTLRNMEIRGDIKPVRIGRCVRFRAADIEAICSGTWPAAAAPASAETAGGEI